MINDTNSMFGQFGLFNYLSIELATLTSSFFYTLNFGSVALIIFHPFIQSSMLFHVILI
jgi:hypothetical protein